MTGLRISADLAPIPLDAVTSTFGILAIRGAGKSYTASVLAEEFLSAGQRIVVVDPTGAWWGLRAGADGNAAGGFPIFVLGGEHGHMELREDMGEQLGRLVAAGSFSVVLDLSGFETEASRTRFLLAFVRTLHHVNREPIHVFMDEADDYIPQVVRGDVARLVGVCTRLVKLGRRQGIGVSLITQRAASLNKNVLSQIETLIALRNTSPGDLKTIRGWMQAREGMTTEQRDQMLAALPSLPNGTAFVWSPMFLGGVLERVRIRARVTFDSGATPKVGQVRAVPRAFAPVDVDTLRRQLAPAAAAKGKKSKAGKVDPMAADLAAYDLAGLREENAILLAQRDEARAQLAQVKVEREQDQAQLRTLARLGRDLATWLGQAAQPSSPPAGRETPSPRWGPPDGYEIVTAAPLLSTTAPAQHFAPRPIDVAPHTVHGTADGPGVRVPGRRSASPADVAPRRHDVAPGVGSMEKAIAAAADGDTLDLQPGKHEASGLRKGERAMLAAISSARRPLTRSQIALLAGISPRTGTFASYLSTLRTRALIQYDGASLIGITQAGVDLAGVPPAATTAELRALWRSKLRGGEARMLDILIGLYPEGTDRADLAERSGVSPRTGTFASYLSTLNTNGLCETRGRQLFASSSLFLSNG